jgi:hypothetical protein
LIKTECFAKLRGMANSRHEHATRHRTGRHFGHRSVALVVAVKVAIVVVVVALPSWLAISLGAAHGVALALVAVAGAVLLVVGRRRRGRSTAVPAAEASVETTDASRYLVQFCTHATKIGAHFRSGHTRPDVLGVELSDTHGTLELSWGRCVLDADQDALTVRVEADTEEHLRGIQDIVTADLERFGHRDDLTVRWYRVSAGQRAGDDGDADQDADGGDERQRGHGHPGQST